jgi:hypothetical protein
MSDGYDKPSKADEDAALQSVAKAGRSRGLVQLVRAAFAVDRLFDGFRSGPVY